MADLVIWFAVQSGAVIGAVHASIPQGLPITKRLRLEGQCV